MTVKDVMQGSEMILLNVQDKKESRVYSPKEVENYIMEYLCSSQSAEEYAASKGISRSTFYWWLKVYIKDNGCRSYKDHEIPLRDTVSGKVEDRQINRKKKELRTVQEKEDIIKKFAYSGLSMTAFANKNGISYGSLREWVNRYKDKGPEGLKSRKIRNAVMNDQEEVTEKKIMEMIRDLRIRILELELRIIKLMEKNNMNIERGWEQNDRTT